MNPRTALLAAIVALALVLATWLVTRTRSTVPAAPLAHHAALAQCTSAVRVSVTGAEGSTASLIFDAPTELWMLETGGTRWPVEAAAMQGCLRLLADLSKLPASSVSAPDDKRGVTLHISVPGHAELVLFVPGSGIGGRVGVLERVEGGWVSVEADARLADLFQPGNITAWRRTDLLAGAGVVSGVRAESAGRRLALRQIDGRWALVHPVACPADQDAARQLAVGSSVLARRFLDQEASRRVENMFDSPTALLTRTFRLPPAADGASGGELVVELTCGQSADAAQATFLARARAYFADRGVERDPAWGPVTCVVDRSAIEGFAKQAEFYVSSRSVQAPSMDVTRVQVFGADGSLLRGQAPMPPARRGHGETDFTRTLDGWTIAHGTEGHRACDRPTTDLLHAALRAMCDDAADRTILGEHEDDVRVLGAVGVHGSRGLLEVLVVGERGEGQRASVAVRCGRVWREYAGQAGEAIRRLVREHLKPEG